MNKRFFNLKIKNQKKKYIYCYNNAKEHIYIHG